MSAQLINVARDFSPNPIGRYRWQARFSGEAFREDLLVPTLQRADMIAIVLDGTSGLSTGFLDEAFAGLIRERILSPSEFHRRVSFVANEDPYVLEDIKAFVEDAAAKLDA